MGLLEGLDLEICYLVFTFQVRIVHQIFIFLEVLDEGYILSLERSYN